MKNQVVRDRLFSISPPNERKRDGEEAGLDEGMNSKPKLAKLTTGMTVSRTSLQPADEDEQLGGAEGRA